VGCMIEESGRHGIFVRDPVPGNANTDWQVLDNYIAGAGGDGIRLDNAAGWMIERNHVYGVERNSIYAARLWGTSITDNYIEDFGRSEQAGTYYGIFGSLQGDDSASTIANNRIFEFGGAPNAASSYVFVGLTGNYGTGAVSVTGNAIRGPMPTKPNTTGLSFARGEADSVRVTSTGNLVGGVRTVRLVGEGVKVDVGR
jgi:Right handed beta helix region